MNCEICGEERHKLFSLPLRQENGFLCTTACLQCAEMTDAFCSSHCMPHIGFIDGTSACYKCIEDTTEGHMEQAMLIVERLAEGFSPREWNELLDLAHTNGLITRSSVQKGLLRVVATKALRSKKTIDATISEMIASKNVYHVLF